MLLSASDDEHTFAQNNIKQWFFDNQQQRESYGGALLSGLATLNVLLKQPCSTSQLTNLCACSCTEEIEYFCRPTLLHWLVKIATTPQRRCLRDILLQVAGFSRHQTFQEIAERGHMAMETSFVEMGVPQRNLQLMSPTRSASGGATAYLECGTDMTEGSGVAFGFA